MAKHHPERGVEMTLRNCPGYERIVRVTAMSIARQMGMGQERVDALGTALVEACRNAVEHGNGGNQMLPVTISFEMRPTVLLVEIADCGGGFQPPPPPDIEAQLAGREARRGWGIHLMRHLMDQVSFQVNARGEHLTRLQLSVNGAGNARQGDDL